MALSPGSWILFLVVIVAVVSLTSAANYPYSYYRRICYRPHCYHGYRSYNFGYLAAGKWSFLSQNANETVAAALMLILEYNFKEMQKLLI